MISFPTPDLLLHYLLSVDVYAVLLFCETFTD